MPDRIKILWRREGKRLLRGYSGQTAVALIFGAPAPQTLWCAIVWTKADTPSSHLTEYHGTLRAAKRWARETLEAHRAG